MSRRQKEPLRALSDEERKALSQLSRSGRSPSGRVARATALLAVAEGQSYTAAAKLYGSREAGWAAQRRYRGPLGGALQSRRPRSGGAAPWRRAARPLCRGAAAAHSRRGRADPGPSPRWRGDVVLEHAAPRPAQGAGRPPGCQHLHDLANAARGGPELAEEPHLVRDRGGHASAQAWHGHGRRP